MIELSPRLGGNGVPLIASRYLGIDLVALSLGQALAEPATLPVPSTQTTPSCSLVLGSDRSGRLRSVATVEEVMAEVPAVFEIETTIGPGASVNAFRHGGDGFGYALFHSRSEDDYRTTVKEIQAALPLEVRASGGLMDIVTHQPDFSIVIPVYNAAPTLVELHERLVSVMESLGRPFEVVMVDDGSRDDSWRVICTLARRDRRVRGLQLMRNYGQANATYGWPRGFAR